MCRERSNSPRLLRRRRERRKSPVQKSGTRRSGLFDRMFSWHFPPFLSSVHCYSCATRNPRSATLPSACLPKNYVDGGENPVVFSPLNQQLLIGLNFRGRVPGKIRCVVCSDHLPFHSKRQDIPRTDGGRGDQSFEVHRSPIRKLRSCGKFHDLSRGDDASDRCPVPG